MRNGLRLPTLWIALVAGSVLIGGCADDQRPSAEGKASENGLEEKHERGPLQVVVRVSPKEPTIADKIELSSM